MTNIRDGLLAFRAAYETALSPIGALDVVDAYAEARAARVFNRTDRVIQVQLGLNPYGLPGALSVPMNLDAVASVDDGHPTLVQVTITSDETLPRTALMGAAFADAAEDTVARLQRRSRGTTVS
ncbi:hypothetical protein [Agreia sp. COWG]|uniref:hypothetical protein n=1 Tax=Agreia sp. COWG TaxID=2773266 RepID=UPI001928F682|nr:hypothetical protein [Agreia sp. COWG]CAD6007066.1 conserved protein of unknown function [Agreia sp. COWG]